MKKIIYVLAFFCMLVVFGGLIFFRINDKKDDITIVSKELTPTAKVKKDKSDETQKTETKSLSNSALLIEDEIFIADLTADLNLDGFDDKIIAFKRASDNGVYLTAAVQNPVRRNYIRGETLRIDLTQAGHIFLSGLDLGLDEKPAVLCSGTAQDNRQVLMIFTVEESENLNMELKQIAVFRADVQIRINKNPHAQANNFSLYTISCFDSDTTSLNSLAQIEKIYLWSESENTFKKVDENYIKGEKIESQILKKIGSGNVKLFREFLNGLWVKNSGNKEDEKLFYFDDYADEITFTTGKLQEMYVISKFNQRHYGLYLTTYNKSLTSITLRVDIEIKSLTEVYVHVTENVTRLKIGAASLWNGVYKKQDDSTFIKSNPDFIALKNQLNTKNVVWKNDKYKLKIDGDKFHLKTPEGLRIGNFTFFDMQDKKLLQMRCEKDNRFYELSFVDDALILSEVQIKINSVKDLGRKKIILKASEN